MSEPIVRGVRAAFIAALIIVSASLVADWVWQPTGSAEGRYSTSADPLGPDSLGGDSSVSGVERVEIGRLASLVDDGILSDGFILMPNGSPVAGASIAIIESDSGEGLASQETGEDGSFTFGHNAISREAVGDLVVEAVSPGFVRERVGVGRGILIVLCPSVVLTVGVYDKESSLPVSGARVLVAEEPGKGPLSVTNAEGIAKASAAPASVRKLSIRAPGYLHALVRGYSRAPGSEVVIDDIELTPARFRPIHVIGIDGRPVYDPVFEVTTPGPGGESRWVRAECSRVVGALKEPSFSVVPGEGSMSVRVVADGCSPKAITLRGSDNEPIVVELMPGVSVSGRIVDGRSGEALVDAEVTVACGAGEMRVQTDASGAYIVQNLPMRASVNVAVDAEGYVSWSDRLVTPDSSGAWGDVELSRNDGKSIAVCGVVVDQGGDPCARGVSVLVTRGGQVEAVPVGVDGEFCIPCYDGDVMDVAVSHSSRVNVYLKSVSVDMSPLKVVLRDGDVIEGVVHDEEGGGVVGAFVQALYDGQEVSSDTTGLDGGFILRGLGYEAEYSVLATMPGYHNYRLASGVSSGDYVEYEMKRLGEVFVELRDPVGLAPGVLDLSIWHTNRTGRSYELGAKGAQVSMPSGTYPSVVSLSTGEPVWRGLLEVPPHRRGLCVVNVDIPKYIDIEVLDASDRPVRGARVVASIANDVDFENILTSRGVSNERGLCRLGIVGGHYVVRVTTDRASASGEFSPGMDKVRVVLGQ